MSSDREKLLRQIQALCFAITDLNLYLDSHIEAKDISDKIDEYQKQADLLKAEYEEKYGPLSSNNLEKNRWSWISSPWPWENSQGEE